MYFFLLALFLKNSVTVRLSPGQLQEFNLIMIQWRSCPHHNYRTPLFWVIVKKSGKEEKPAQSKQPRQVVESGCKLNLCIDLCWVPKRTSRKFLASTRKSLKNKILRQTILYFIG